MLHTLCYISNSVDLWQSPKLEEFFSYVKTKNIFRNITGLLLYNEGTFLQVLEGEIDDINTLLSKIEKDERHNQITVIMHREINHRFFESYQTGLVLYREEKYLKRLKSKLQLPDISKYSQSLKAILQSFTYQHQSLAGA
ncbi:MAG: BLUF domain-containing protein [Flavobacteriaceae bacterium]|nr:BLUF domain-containing protein [Flavobacteriaceae bacterium]